MSSFRLSDRHHSILACTGTLRRRHWSINFGRSESQQTLAFDDGSRVAEDIKVTLHAASQVYSARSIRACRNYPAEWSRFDLQSHAPVNLVAKQSLDFSDRRIGSQSRMKDHTHLGLHIHSIQRRTPLCSAHWKNPVHV